MHKNHSFTGLAITWFFIFALGCSGEIPFAPSPDKDLSQPTAAGNSSGRLLWGMWRVSIDSATGEIEIIPQRTAAFNVNVMQFLHPPYSPVHKMQINILPSSDLASGYVEVDVTFNHPFPGLNQYRGFDVRGIFMADGSQQTQHDPGLRYGDGKLNEAYMLNPDGYTRWWNASEFSDPMAILSFKPGKLGNDSNPTATLNPYKYYADDLAYGQDVATMTTNNRGVFSPTGPVHKRLYKIQFPVNAGVPSYTFSYAVDASWYEPDKSYAPEYPIESFPPSAQCQEAYHLSVNTKDSDVWYESGKSGGSVKLKIEVFDWQGATNPSGVPGEVKAILVESPILANPVNVLPLSTAIPGSQSTSSVFQAELSGPALKLSSSGQFPVLICVESVSPDNYQPQITGGEVFVFPDSPLAAYNFGMITVGDKQPYTIADDITGNLKLSVIRSGGRSISGILLDWTANTNPSPFYAIYADDNPYDGFNVNKFVAEVTTNTATINSASWPAFSTNNAYVFGVKGRTVSGLVASESPNLSQLAFVEMEDFDGGASAGQWNIGFRNALYKWEIVTGQIDGSTSIRCNPATPTSQWSAIIGPVVPVVPFSEKSFLEFAHLAAPGGFREQFSGGFSHSVPPTGTDQYLDYDSTSDFYCIMDGTWNWVMPAGPPPGGGWTALIERYGWNQGSTFFGWRAQDMPKGTAQITRMDMPHFRNTAGSIRPGLAWATLSYAAGTDWIEADEIAIVVY